ncbi:MAG TPA: hypothetical protein VIK72_19570 [Clostridiaceae bacterium]
MNERDIDKKIHENEQKILWHNENAKRLRADEKRIYDGFHEMNENWQKYLRNKTNG